MPTLAADRQYGSIIELAESAMRAVTNPTNKFGRLNERFHGITRRSEAKRLALMGWDAEAPDATDIADSVVSTVTKEHEMPQFRPVWDVTGSMVDIGAYLSGVPENMIEVTMPVEPKHGRVISLCASISISGAVSTESIKRRGHAIAALCIALTNIGINVELYADLTTTGGGKVARIRTLVKGCDDDLDIARIMYAYAHPSMLRVMGLGDMHNFPKDVKTAIGVGMGYGMPTDPIEDLPEGTIYLPSVLSGRDIPDPERFVTDHLRSLGIIES